MVSFIVWLLNNLINIYVTLIVIWCILTWFPGAMESSLGQFLSRLVRPYLDVFERIIPPLGGISFAPVVALMVLWFAQMGIRGIASML